MKVMTKSIRRVFDASSPIRRKGERAGGPKRWSCRGKQRVDGKSRRRARETESS